MDKNSNAYVIVFATTVCVILATALAATYNGLKSTIEANLLFDKQRNVLIACGLYKMEEGKSQPELEKLFADKVVVKVIEFTDPPRARSILTFGQSGRNDSPHYLDQAPLYANKTFKPAWFTKAEVKANTTRAYHPGQE